MSPMHAHLIINTMMINFTIPYISEGSSALPPPPLPTRQPLPLSARSLRLETRYATPQKQRVAEASWEALCILENVLCATRRLGMLPNNRV